MSLSLDLDNKWCYLRTFGKDSWETFPTYLPLVVPRILDFFESRDVKITFYIVGKDATIEENSEALKSIARAGHELGNHSFFHEPWLHLYTEEEFTEDLRKSEEAIEAVTGIKVSSFRGPGYSLTPMTLKVLKARGYEFDATAFPNLLNPLARAYLFATTELSDEEKKRRKALFGSFSDAFRPVKPYQWNIDGERLLELPVTTMPIFKIPIHFSYLTYLGIFSTALARAYLATAIFMCRVTGTEPSLLLHPLDFMGREDDSELSDFPGMKLPVAKKLELMSLFVDRLAESFEPMTMGEHVAAIRATRTLKTFEPEFAVQKA